MSIYPITFTSQNVCWSCRTRKQRCDKALPKCSRCVSKLFHCDYRWAEIQCQPEPCQATRVVSPTLLVERSCPECFDLSSDGAKKALYAVGINPNAEELGDVTAALLEAADMTTTTLIKDFSATIHERFPIIDLQVLGSKLVSKDRNDIKMNILLLSLYLVTRLPCKKNKHSMRSMAYETMKRILMLQFSGETSLELLQTGLLVAYYECGHGLSREAHITLMNCISVSRLMGLEFERIGNDIEPDSVDSSCLWATVLLDRTLALSSLDNKVPLGLPVNLDQDMEYVKPVLDPNRQSSSFCVLSRVALAIGAAVDYVRRSPHQHWTWYHKIHNRMESLVSDLIHAADSSRDSLAFCPATSLAMSALFAIQSSAPAANNWDVTSVEEMRLYSMIRMIRDTSQEATHIMLKSNHGSFEEGPGTLSIIIVCALARAAVLLVRLRGDELSDDDRQMLRFNLRSFGARWSIADSYLHEFDEVLLSSARGGISPTNPRSSAKRC